MTINAIRELYEARPFRPFKIRLASGKEELIPHPEFVSFAPSGRFVIVTRKDDSFTMIDLNLAESAEIVVNGKRKSRK